MKRSVNDLTASLKSAIAEDQGAMEEALQRGIDATQPLSQVRLAELCALGERMTETKARRSVAEGELERGLDLAALARPVRSGASPIRVD